MREYWIQKGHWVYGPSFVFKYTLDKIRLNVAKRIGKWIILAYVLLQTDPFFAQN